MVAVRGTIRLVVWCVALAATLTVLHQLPVPGGPVDLASRDAADLVSILLRGCRWVALGCAWYLAGATVLAALSSVVAWRPLCRLDAALTVPVVRRVVRTGLGAVVVVGVGLGPSAAAAVAPGPPGASGRSAPPAEEVPIELPEPREVDGPTPGTVDPPRPPAVAEPAPGAAPEATSPPAVERSGASVAATHEVVAGESFWSIAADLTAAELGRAPDDAEVFERWVVLIETNRDRLVVPDDPDLLLPGQQLRLPGGDR